VKLRAFIGVLGVSVSAFAAPAPSQAEIDTALKAALDVRDSNEDDTYVDVAGAFVVEEVDVRLALEYARFERTKGAQGVPRRTALEEVGTGEDSKVVALPIPEVVQATIRARDEYIARVPANKDREKNAILYAFDGADVLFVYGQFAEARARFERIYGERGLRDPWGLRAWEKLVSIAAKSHELDRAEALARANPSSDLSTDVFWAVSYARAERAADKKKVWAEAAQRQEDAFRAGPKRKEAARAAMRAAFAWKQARNVGRAIGVYESFIRENASERLDAERVTSLQLAYEDLAATYHGMFDYSKAADTYGAIASHPRFEQTSRKDAARNAMVLYAALGRRDKVLEEHAILSKLTLTDEERANADYLVADTPQAFASYYERYKASAFASTHALEAAWKVAQSKKRTDAGYRAWLENTVAAWQRLGKNTAPYADMGAEADLALIDDELVKKFDYDTGHHRYVTLSAEDVLGKPTARYDLDVREAAAYDTRLAHLIRTYASPTFIAAAIARRGSLYDSLRSGLYDCAGSQFKVVPPDLVRVLAQMRASGDDKVVDKADAIQEAIKKAWQLKRDQEIDVNDAVMIGRYAQASALAKAWDLKMPAVTHARSRLTYFARIIDEAKLRLYVTSTLDPTDPTKKLTYVDGMFVHQPLP
jgi:hypothetical protein